MFNKLSPVCVNDQREVDLGTFGKKQSVTHEEEDLCLFTRLVFLRRSKLKTTDLFYWNLDVGQRIYECFRIVQNLHEHWFLFAH